MSVKATIVIRTRDNRSTSESTSFCHDRFRRAEVHHGQTEPERHNCNRLCVAEGSGHALRLLRYCTLGDPDYVIAYLNQLTSPSNTCVVAGWSYGRISAGAYGCRP